MQTDWSGWVEIFRAGDFGAKGTYTEADLDRIVSSYDPKVHEAPLTIGHPEHDRPAYGWVAQLKRDGKQLLAKFSSVQDEFKGWIERGLYKTRSVSLYRNPAKDGGALSLRHVGFLGAMPPEVKGLAALPMAAFSDDGRERVEFNFQDGQGGFMNWFGGKKSSDVVTNADLQKFEEGLGDKVDSLLRERLGNRLEALAESLGEKISDAIDGALFLKFRDLKKETLEQVGNLVNQKVNDSVDKHPFFAEGHQSMSKKYPRRLDVAQHFDPVVGVEDAQDAEELAKEEGIPYAEALARVREHNRSLAGQGDATAVYKIGDQTFTEDPGNPVDKASVERANQAGIVSKERGLSYRDGLTVVRRAEALAASEKITFSEALGMV